MSGRSRRRGWSGRTQRIVFAAAALLLVAGVSAAFLSRAEGGEIPANVRVGGVEVGGLSHERATARLRDHAREIADDTSLIESRLDPDLAITISRSELGGRPRVAAALEQASAPRSRWSRVVNRLGLADAREVPLTFQFERARLQALVARLRGELDIAPTNAGVEVGNVTLSVTPSAPGRSLRFEPFSEALQEFPERIEAPVTPEPPPVDDDAAHAARRVAQSLLDRPPTVILGTVRRSLTETEVRAALGFAERPPALTTQLDPERLRTYLGEAFRSGERMPRDAEFRVVGERVEITPSRAGRGVDMERLARTLVARAGRPQTGARFTVIEPDLTTAEARAMRITDRIARFTTFYPCCPARVTNIQRAAEILDGTIVPAGARFSLNAALGERTTERGFVSAGQIVAGRLEDAVGGGVSQIATTVFNAAFFAGLEIVTHTPHQFYISRYPEGREATISWGGPELIFRNDWQAAVLMRVSAGSQSVTVDLYSSPLGRSVETEVLSRTPGREARVNEKLDRDLPPGTRTVLQEPGAAGFSIRYSRIVRVDGETTRNETFAWNYSAQDGFVEIGPPKKERPDDDAQEPDRDRDEPQDDSGTTTDADAPQSEPDDPDASKNSTN